MNRDKIFHKITAEGLGEVEDALITNISIYVAYNRLEKYRKVKRFLELQGFDASQYKKRENILAYALDALVSAVV